MSWEDNVRKVVPYVAGEQPKNPNIIKLNTNECPYSPAPGVDKVLKNMNTDILRKYPDPDVTDIRKLIAARNKLDIENVFVGVGSDDVLSMSFLTFFNSDKPVIFPDVTYSFYDVWAELYRIPYKMMPLNDKFELVKDDYMTPNGGVVIANPNAPTGLMAPVSVIEEIIKANPEVVVIVDEAYVDFGGESCLPLINKYENLLVVQTFSKSRSMAGMRIGFAMGSKKIIGYLSDAKFSFNSYTMNTTAILAGAASLEDEEYFQKTTAKVIATRERTKRELSALGFSFPDSKTNFIFAKHESIPGQELFDMLKANNIFVRHWNKPRISEYLRISIGTDDEMNQVIEFLKKYISTRKGNM